MPFDTMGRISSNMDAARLRLDIEIKGADRKLSTLLIAARHLQQVVKHSICICVHISSFVDRETKVILLIRRHYYARKFAIEQVYAILV